MRYGFAWGGNYVSPTRPDAMHNEFMGTPTQADQATTLARQELGHLQNTRVSQFLRVLPGP